MNNKVINFKKNKHRYEFIIHLHKKIKKKKIGICSILGGSGSVIPEVDLDPYQNKADPKHCFCGFMHVIDMTLLFFLGPGTRYSAIRTREGE